MQTCRKCNAEKPIEQFHFHRVSGKHYQTCKSCRLQNQYAWIKNNRDKVNGYNRKWTQANPEKRWEKRNPELAKQKAVIATKKHREANPDAWKKNYVENKPRYAANRAKRRAVQKSATPSWLTAIHKAQIQEMYEIALARDVQTGVKHHVDHIVPIMGENVSGMHVPWNLRVITAKENLSKGWRFQCQH